MFRAAAEAIELTGNTGSCWSARVPLRCGLASMQVLPFVQTLLGHEEKRLRSQRIALVERFGRLTIFHRVSPIEIKPATDYRNDPATKFCVRRR
jgi:hypothetical protein